mmetsp:Transcript_30627/g.49128  ORF Transcript_30627/g.49128 Transcript_30627/m.49128 type:complete len:144 (-) Transcript_30627:262-693(-)
MALDFQSQIRRWIANSDGESESKLPPYGIGVFTSNNNTAAVVGKSSPSPSPSSSFMLTRTTNSNNVSSRVSALAANILSPTPTITMGIPSSAAAGASLPPPSLLPHLSSSSSSSLLLSAPSGCFTKYNLHLHFFLSHLIITLI